MIAVESNIAQLRFDIIPIAYPESQELPFCGFTTSPFDSTLYFIILLSSQLFIRLPF
jgi:hypothetical protein